MINVFQIILFEHNLKNLPWKRDLLPVFHIKDHDILRCVAFTHSVPRLYYIIYGCVYPKCDILFWTLSLFCITAVGSLKIVLWPPSSS